jgi:hypothetical protein
MITAHQEINPSTGRRRVNIMYDKGLNFKPQVKICPNEQAANDFIEKQYAYAVRTVLTNFAKQRLFIANEFPGVQGASKKIHSAETIIREMAHHEVAPLVVVAAAVYWLKPCIQDLEPSASSRYHRHYTEFIEPMIDWAFHYSKKVREQQLEREKRTNSFYAKVNDFLSNID